MIIAVATFAFVFISLAVAVCRACDTLQRHAQSNDRLRNVTHYRGATFNRHGREIVHTIDAIRRVI